VLPPSLLCLPHMLPMPRWHDMRAVGRDVCSREVGVSFQAQPYLFVGVLGMLGLLGLCFCQLRVCAVCRAKLPQVATVVSAFVEPFLAA
jgi:hypothetical protein